MIRDKDRDLLKQYRHIIAERFANTQTSAYLGSCAERFSKNENVFVFDSTKIFSVTNPSAQVGFKSEECLCKRLPKSSSKS